MKRFNFITSTIPGTCDPSLAIAGCRAGALGILNIEFAQNWDNVSKALRKLAQYTTSDFGIKISTLNFVESNFKTLPSSVRKRLTTIIISPPNDNSIDADLKELVSVFHSFNLKILLECTSYDQAKTGEKLNVEGLIAKGSESGCRIGNETTFILLQHLLANFSLPVWAHGGIGLQTAAGCLAAGAAGIVLDAQLALTKESPLSQHLRNLLSKMDGRETVCIGDSLGQTYRFCSRTAKSELEALHHIERILQKKKLKKAAKIKQWHEAVSREISRNDSNTNLLCIGEDIAFAQPLAHKYVTVGGILQALEDNISESCLTAAKHQPLRQHSSLAQAHGTVFPIVQGPMARVSDNPDFAQLVAENGALPFIAAAWLRREELDLLLSKTALQLQDKSWGVGLLGFLPAEIYQEQISVILAKQPPYALIAGGRPAQVEQLEAEGVKTYIHVPTVSLLNMFLDAGLKRFVFEGREAGGHVGPLSSFVHWESMIMQLLKFLEANKGASGYQVLFAGGIKDARSSAIIAAMASVLAEKGVALGVQLGSAYLFTEEAVKTGAIVKKYQDELLRCTYTTLLETGPGHAVRCVNTPFAKLFNKEKNRLRENKTPPDKIRQILEKMELGRLRIATKGLVYASAHQQKAANSQKLVALSPKEQLQEGIYMIGQVAALQDNTLTIADLHHDISDLGSREIEPLSKQKITASSRLKREKPSDIAIIGMSCFFPEAPDLKSYWQNILNSVNAIREIPKDRWDVTPYFDDNKNAKDRIYAKWGGFLDDIPFDPLIYGMPPNVLSSVEPLHLLALETVRFALMDAGYARRPFRRDRTSVVIGISGAGEVGQLYGFRASLPMFFGDKADEIVSYFDTVLPEWTEDSFPGLLMNVAAGRISNRFDLGGMNTLVDSACASSLAALYLGVKELETNSCDMAIVGGADCMQNPFTYMCFSKTQALSPRGVCNSLDENADGIVIGEGLGTVIMKRLRDAEHDGDRIYAVIRGMGASSDGRDRSLTAPGRNGQLRALQRAYAKANISPAQVELIEAHATGTTEGDKVEIGSLTQHFQQSGAAKHGCAIGSVKSMIGHTKSTAGLASLIKIAMALHHKVIPPTLGVKKPNPGLQIPDSPFYIPNAAKPWLPQKQNKTRKAGISAFGFGGTNYHAVLEEYCGDFLKKYDSASYQQWPTELFYWHGTSRQELLQTVNNFAANITGLADEFFPDLAFGCFQKSSNSPALSHKDRVSIAIVASSKADLLQKLQIAGHGLAGTDTAIDDPRGIFFTENPLGREGKIAFLFPGQGSQYVNMLADLAIQFPPIRQLFELSNHLLAERLKTSLSAVIYPPAAFTDDEHRMQARTLAQTDIAQPALGTVNLALFNLLKAMAVEPDMVAGHSYGEYVALCAAGVMSEEELILLSEARARFILNGAGTNPGTMAAVETDQKTVSSSLSNIDDVWVANINSPVQTVITGTKEGIEKATMLFTEKNIKAKILPVSCAFHSPLMQPACKELKSYLARLDFKSPQVPVFSNTTGQPHLEAPQKIKDQLLEHIVQGVNFIKEIETMYAHGARIFVEVGPGRVLTGLTQKILENRPHTTVISNQASRSGFTQVQHLLAQLVAHGVAPDMNIIFKGRNIRPLDEEKLPDQSTLSSYSSTTYLVNGSVIRKPEKKGTPKPARTIKAYPLSSEQRNALPADITDQPGSYLPQDDRENVMLLFQKQMQHFLETQKKVMTLFLHGHGAADNPQFMQDAASAHTSSSQSVLPVSPLPEKIAPTFSNSGSSEPSGSIPDEKQVSHKITADPDVTAEHLTARLLHIVSERTGYPEEMLNMNLNLEAELGIDSIKRVEILGEFIKEILPDTPSDASVEMENLRGVSTLQGIIEWAAGNTIKVKAQADQGSTEVSDENIKVDLNVNRLPHFTLSPVKVSDPAAPLKLPHNKVVLITDDGKGVARSIFKKLHDDGFTVAVIRWDTATDEVFGESQLLLKNSDIKEIKQAVDAIQKNYGAIGTIIHLLPLQEQSQLNEMSFPAWKEKLYGQIRPLFFLTKLLSENFTGSETGEKPTVLAATSMGGSFGLDDSQANRFFPGQAAVCGFLKSVALEYPEVLVKIIDLSPENTAEEQACWINKELAGDDGLVEVGYINGERMSLGLFETTPGPNDENTITIDSSSVILITGGARGITAKVALEIARRHKPVMILLGRSPLPPEEDSDIKNLSTPQELKSAIIAKMKSQGTNFQIADVEKTYQQTLKNREIRANLAALKNHGATVEYIEADVRSKKTFTSAIASIYQRHGKIDGVIHGAGIIEDKLLKDKSWDSFERVLGTKAESLFLLAKALKKETLQFLALFSSVAGRFGNIGQSDYTAANEVLNKFALALDRAWQGRIVSLNWGPWEGAGMASEEVQRQFNERRVGLIGPQAGSESFLREICQGKKGNVEIVIGDGPWRKGLPSQALAASPLSGLPLLHSVHHTRRIDDHSEFPLVLSREKDIYINDHCLDGKPVLPATMAIEFMAEAALAACPGMLFNSIRDVKVFRGIVLEDGDQPLVIKTGTQAPGKLGDEKIELIVEIFDPQKPQLPFYKSSVILGKERLKPTIAAPHNAYSLEPFRFTPREAYEKWLFHGPLFQCIKEIEGISEKFMVATLKPSCPHDSFVHRPKSQWVLDPIVLDGSLQMALLWGRKEFDITLLPAVFKAVHFFHPFHQAKTIKCFMEIVETSARQNIICNMIFRDEKETLLGMIERVEANGSKALNRLVGIQKMKTEAGQEQARYV